MEDNEGLRLIVEVEEEKDDNDEIVVWAVLEPSAAVLDKVEWSLETSDGVRGTEEGTLGTEDWVRGTEDGVRGTEDGVRGTDKGVRGSDDGVAGSGEWIAVVIAGAVEFLRKSLPGVLVWDGEVDGQKFGAGAHVDSLSRAGVEVQVDRGAMDEDGEDDDEEEILVQDVVEGMRRRYAPVCIRLANPSLLSGMGERGLDVE